MNEERTQETFSEFIPERAREELEALITIHSALIQLDREQQTRVMNSIKILMGLDWIS